MKRLLILIAASLGGDLGVAGLGLAQIPYGRTPGGVPVTQPTYSPYLNLLRRDNSVLQNYWGLVRPEIEFRRDLIGLQQQVTLTQQGPGGNVDPLTGLPYTGHPTQFLNLSRYYPLRAGAAGYVSAGGVTAPVSRPLPGATGSILSTTTQPTTATPRR
jgi:hypothetical protein